MLEDLSLTAAKALGTLDPRFARLFNHIEPPAFRHRADGFEGLIRLIIEQQLSVKAADSIWQRLKSGLSDMTPEAVLALDEAVLRSYGLSRPKLSYVRHLSQAVLSGTLDIAALKSMTTEDAIAHLTLVKGIGRWSAEVYLMFCEGRLDIFPTGDIALREAVAWLDGLEARPDEAYCLERALVWAPHRSLAAHSLWSWYGKVKRGELGREILEQIPKTGHQAFL